MPVKAYQLPAKPQLPDKAQARLQQTQGRSAHVVNKLLLSTGYDIRAPQQQPRVDQRQGQQQPLQAVRMAHSGQFQAKPAPVVFEIFEHLLNGMITNDKFCCTRWDSLRLSWWRRPKRLRG